MPINTTKQGGQAALAAMSVPRGTSALEADVMQGDQLRQG